LPCGFPAPTPGGTARSRIPQRHGRTSWSATQG
jgi:hypothetical protein